MIDNLYQTGSNGLGVFLLVTVVLGGAASWATGRAIAMTWKPLWQLALYIGLMTFAVRFIHYALFHGPFLKPGNFIIDYLVLLAMALAGYRAMRAWQMHTQYSWLFDQVGPFSWRRKH